MTQREELTKKDTRWGGTRVIGGYSQSYFFTNVRRSLFLYVVGFLSVLFCGARQGHASDAFVPSQLQLTDDDKKRSSTHGRQPLRVLEDRVDAQSVLYTQLTESKMALTHHNRRAWRESEMAHRYSSTAFGVERACAENVLSGGVTW